MNKYDNVTEKINIKMYTEHKPDEIIKGWWYPHLSQNSNTRRLVLVE